MATGILPAAGAGLRLRPFSYPKELLPIAFTRTDGGIRPVLAVEFALQTLAIAGCTKVVIAVGPDKLALPRLLGSGEALGMRLAFIVQDRPIGLVDAVQRCLNWVDGNAVLQLPDTLFAPEDASSQVVEALAHADLALGLFPTDRPTQLGPVRTQRNQVVEIQDKPDKTDLNNTWGVAAWTPRFTKFLTDFDGTAPIGLAFQSFLTSGGTVSAVHFEAGRYHDIGTTRSLAELVIP